MQQRWLLRKSREKKGETIMGTRSLTKIYAADGESIIACIYRQYDGYPTGMGKDIQDTFEGSQLVNGISSNIPFRQVNGMEEAAAILVCELKKDNPSGNIYLNRPDAEDCWEEFTYRLNKGGDGKLHLSVHAGKELLYAGPLDEFDPVAVEAQVYDDE